MEEKVQREFTSVIEKRGNWYIGYVEELAGVNTEISDFLAMKICQDLGIPKP